MATADKTGPIELPTAFLREPGAPEPVGSKRRPSELIESICHEAMEIGRSKDPSETQIAKMSADISSLERWAKLGLEAKEVISALRSNGGGRGGGPVTVVASVVLAGAVAIGLPSLTWSDDAAQAKVLSEQTAAATRADNAAQDQRLTNLESRQAAEERQRRRVQGLTVRWLGDNYERQCEALKLIAAGINRVGRPKSDPVEIDCKSASLPPELVALEAQLEIEEGARQ